MNKMWILIVTNYHMYIYIMIIQHNHIYIYIFCKYMYNIYNLSLNRFVCLGVPKKKYLMHLKFVYLLQPVICKTNWDKMIYYFVFLLMLIYYFLIFRGLNYVFCFTSFMYYYFSFFGHCQYYVS